ncbi:hypothetical protein KFE25_013617 [Diacronema lutheri]|uniref:Uncharacterized protein n=1 Tax=Diacronema lutheri TaxID=2081491 RepID=A0A8J6CDF1_DIALT|nr:hypothetical protein KFE25_013617 [Diacronema lutheri]
MGFSTLPGKVLGYSLVAAYALAFVIFRATDVVEAYIEHGALPVITSLGAVALLARLIGVNVAIPMSAAAFAWYVDSRMLAPLGEDAKLPDGSIVIITGANAGVGLATSQALAQLGASVTLLLGCRSMAKCEAAAAEVRAEAPGATVVPLVLDLASSRSIRSFASVAASHVPAEVRGELILVNNGGFAPTTDSPPTADGLEAAMGAMHVGHHYLTRRLLVHEGLRARARAGVRVVNVASAMHHYCSLVLLAVEHKLVAAESAPVCLAERMLVDRPRPPSKALEPYAEAKLSNVLHALELARRMGGVEGGAPAVDAIAIDLGWVETSMQPFMTMTMKLSSLGLMRPADIGVRPVVLASLGMPGSPAPTPGVGRLVTPLGRLVREPLTFVRTEPQLAQLAEPLWTMSERLADEWDVAAA